MNDSNQKYKNGEIIKFPNAQVEIIERVSTNTMRYCGSIVDMSIYKVLYDGKEFYASDFGINSNDDNIFKITVAGVGYRGCIDFYNYKKEYGLWKNILYRCYWKNNNLYNYYGAKGVTVDPKWLCFELFLYDFINFSNYNKFKSTSRAYDLDIDSKQRAVPINERMYTPDKVTLRPLYNTDVSVALDDMKSLGTNQTVASIDDSIKPGKKKEEPKQYKPDKFGVWPKEAYTDVVGNPPKLTVPNADNNLDIGVIRTLNGVVNTNKPLLKPVTTTASYGEKAVRREMPMIEMCVIKDKK